MSYRRSYQTSPQADTSTGDPPGWILLSAVLALAALLIGLPAIIAGFFAQRYLQRYLSRWLAWRWSFLFWFILLAASALLFYKLYQHGLRPMITRELTDYVLAAKHHQADVFHWPWAALWADTWPVWLRTLSGVGIVGFYQELVTNTRSDTARTLRQQAQRRERAIARSKRRARRRTSRPAHVPDQIGDMMTIGIPIDEHDEEER